MHTFVGLSGLPRSGSTLLSAILSQNPMIHAEGNSAVCQLMWDFQVSCNGLASEQLTANNHLHILPDIISHIPKLYYKNKLPSKKIIVDKCRTWTSPVNLEMLQKHIDKNVKIIVLERSITDVIKSFAKLFKNNNYSQENIDKLLLSFLEPNTDPIMISIAGINLAKKNNQNNTFLFIKYDDFIKSPEDTIKRIYAFCDWPTFEHQYTNIVNQHPENDASYKFKLNGFHDIRSTIKKDINNIELSKTVRDKCCMIDKLMNY